MKTKLLTIIPVLTLALCSVNTSRASDSANAAADAIFVRPLCLGATVIGSVLFVITLPFTAPARDIRHSAHVLVVKPGAATFTRPLGDFENLEFYD